MTIKKGRDKSACWPRSISFSLLAVLAVLVTPLLTALPVYADWGPAVQLTNAPENSEAPSIAVSVNNVHVAWQDIRDGNYEIYYKHSADGGATWGSDIRLTNAAGNSKSPAVAVSGNNVHVVWFDSRDGDEEIYYKRSTDSGVTWGPDTRLTDCSGVSENPSIAVLGNVVHVAWFDQRDGNPEIYYNRSTDSGTSWGIDTRLTDAAGNSYTPSIAVSGNDVHVAWHDSRDGNEEIYYKRSANGGTTWGVDARLTNTTWSSALASIAVSGNNVHIAWQEQQDSINWEIYYGHSLDGGITWVPVTRLTSCGLDSKYASIAVSGNNIHVVWADSRETGNLKVYYNHSTDNGNTWSDDTSLAGTWALSSYPSIAVSGNNIHVAWQDNSGSYYPRWDIYYKKYTAPAPTITTFAPASGSKRSQVVITGTNFTGTTVVLFGGTRATSFTVNSATQITAIVGTGATGRITVTTPDGTATSAVDFIFLVPNNLISTSPRGSSMSSITTAPSQSPVSLPTVSVRSASLSATQVAPGALVTVTADVVNTGTVNGADSIKVYVNGELESSQGVTVNSGSSTPVTFTVSRNEPGTYSVYVGGTQAGSFTVDQFADPNIILYISGALLVFAFVIGALFIMRRRQLQ